MKRERCAGLTVVIVVVVAVAVSGFAGKAAKAAGSAAGPTKGPSVTLPDWAPKNPSKEFLRAAKVLKPIPQEAQAYSPLYPVLYEFFGTLTDEQIATFLKRKQVSLPVADMSEKVRSFAKEHWDAREVEGKLVFYTHEVGVPFKALTARQRKLFDKVIEAWREDTTGRAGGDLLVILYKIGAKKDLSNVEVRFSAMGGHAVDFTLIVKLLEERLRARSSATGFWFAQL